MTKDSLALGATILAVALLGLGCGPDYWVKFRHLTAAKSDVVIVADEIRLPAGRAAGVEATPMSDDEPLDEDVELELISTHVGILGADRGLGEREFVFYGVERGTASVEVYFDRELVDEIPALVKGP